MALADYLSDLQVFRRSLESCEEILGEGRLLVAPLATCADEPILYTVELTTAVAANDVTADLQIQAPTPANITLKAGQVLQFSDGGGGFFGLTIVADTAINDTAPVAVDIEAAPGVIAVNETVEIFNSYEVVGISSMPLDFQIGTEDVKALRDGIQGKTTKTNIAPQLSIEFFLRADDAGFWTDGLVYTSAVTNRRFYGISLRLNEGQFITGKMETTALTFQDQTSQTQKGTGTVVLQPEWYESTYYDFMSAGEQAAYQDIRRVWGLAEYVPAV
jgi:hypothetical protein